MHINRDGHASGSAGNGSYREEPLPVLPTRVRAPHGHVLRNLNQDALGQAGKVHPATSAMVLVTSLLRKQYACCALDRHGWTVKGTCIQRF